MGNTTNLARDTMPKLIALCGYPQAGKSKLQEIIATHWGATPQDDARILRDAAKVLYGLSEDDVSTQAGKARTVAFDTARIFVPERIRAAAAFLFVFDVGAADDAGVEILGEIHSVADLISDLHAMLTVHHHESRTEQPVRKLLGELGVLCEDRYGEMFVPDRILQSLEMGLGGSFDGCAAMTFGSVRRSQGRVYKQRDGVVIEIVRPDITSPPNPFDDYDRSIVDVTIVNAFDPSDPAASAARLERAALEALRPLLGPERA